MSRVLEHATVEGHLACNARCLRPHAARKSLLPGPAPPPLGCPPRTASRTARPLSASPAPTLTTAALLLLFRRAHRHVLRSTAAPPLPALNLWLLLLHPPGIALLIRPPLLLLWPPPPLPLHPRPMPATATDWQHYDHPALASKCLAARDYPALAGHCSAARLMAAEARPPLPTSRRFRHRILPWLRGG